MKKLFKITLALVVFVTLSFLALLVFALFIRLPLYQSVGLLPEYGVYEIESIARDGSKIRLKPIDEDASAQDMETETYNLKSVVRPSNVYFADWFDKEGSFLLVVHNHKNPTRLYVTLDPDRENAFMRFNRSEKEFLGRTKSP